MCESSIFYTFAGLFRTAQRRKTYPSGTVVFMFIILSFFLLNITVYYGKCCSLRLQDIPPDAY